MRFKLDENLPRAARALLEERGWDVHDVHDEGLAAEPDAIVLAACEREARVLIRLDTDFTDLRRYASPQLPGVIVLRPRDQSIPTTLSCLAGAIRALGVERLNGALWIVSDDRIRIRSTR